MRVLLDVCTGMIVTFLVFSIFVSGVNEWFARKFARRGVYLRLGMERLINDQAVFYRVLHHPLIGSLYRTAATQGKPPSYIDPRNFALALVDVILMRGRDAGPAGGIATASTQALRRALESPALAGSPVGVALRPILDAAGDSYQQALTGIEAWFDGGMDRVGGWYKERTHHVMFLISLTLAVLCNVDALELYASFNRYPATREAFVAWGESIAQSGAVAAIATKQAGSQPLSAAQIEALKADFIAAASKGPTPLPIGYQCFSLSADTLATAPTSAHALSDCWTQLTAQVRGRSAIGWLEKLLGWILSALAGTLGATYWFQLLVKVINLRGSGPKPPAALSTPA